MRPGQPTEHLSFAKHLTAEVKTEEFISGKGMVTKRDRKRKQNHWFDALYNACAAGHYCGVKLVEEMISDRTIRTGIKELQSNDPLGRGRQRRPGGGRKLLESMQDDLVLVVDRLVEPTERGDPQTPLRWTCKSLSNLQSELKRQGYSVGRSKISRIVHALGYSLQGNRKTREGTDHPDRNAQFEHIARRVTACCRGNRPAVSVDTKRRKRSVKRPTSDENIDRKANRWKSTHTTFPTKN